MNGWMSMFLISAIGKVDDVTRLGTWHPPQPIAAKIALPRMASGSSKLRRGGTDSPRRYDWM